MQFKGLTLVDITVVYGVADFSYIFKDWFLSGRIQEVLDQILVIWSHQLDSANYDKIVFARGSPEMDFKPTIANKQVKKDSKAHFLHQYTMNERYAKYLAKIQILTPRRL